MGSRLIDFSELEDFDKESTTKAMKNIENRIARKTYKMNIT